MIQPTRNRISRRDFVQGRFWRALVGRSQSDSSNPTPAPKPTVMRYPQSAGDVAASDRPADEPSASENAAANSARRRTIPVMRPPGAVQENQFLRLCTRCNQCLDACPHDAIIPAPARLREAAGTPMIDPDQQPCWMCRDTPCISACQVNALTSLLPPLMATAKVTQHLCLAHHGTTCTVCSERCPVPDAIEVNDGKPTVNESLCSGCGVCRYVCPAPENAILLMPTFQRPSLAGAQS